MIRFEVKLLMKAMRSVDQEVTAAYENILRAGGSEHVASEAALQLWRRHHQDVSDYEARSAVARLIAVVRLHMRKESRLPRAASGQGNDMSGPEA